jgi:hypothetical protein
MRRAILALAFLFASCAEDGAGTTPPRSVTMSGVGNAAEPSLTDLVELEVEEVGGFCKARGAFWHWREGALCAAVIYGEWSRGACQAYVGRIGPASRGYAHGDVDDQAEGFRDYQNTCAGVAPCVLRYVAVDCDDGYREEWGDYAAYQRTAETPNEYEHYGYQENHDGSGEASPYQ